MASEVPGGLTVVRVAVIDIGTSNIRSLVAALAYLGVEPVQVSDPQGLEDAHHVVLPGVGAYDAAMESLTAHKLVEPLRRHALERGRPLLGVCLGMQLLFTGSDEGERAGLDILPGRFSLLKPDSSVRRKVPHVGFAAVRGFKATGLFSGLGDHADFYFTHSYALRDFAADGNVAWGRHGEPFVAAFQCGLISGAQFHPEKSQSSGLRFLSNFLDAS